METKFQANSGNINPAMHNSFNFHSDSSEKEDTVPDQLFETNPELKSSLPPLEIEKDTLAFTKDTSITSAVHLLGDADTSQIKGPPLRIDLADKKGGTLESFFEVTSNPSPVQDSQAKRRRQEDASDSGDETKKTKPSFSFSNVGPFVQGTKLARTATFKPDDSPKNENRLSLSKMSSLKIVPAGSDSSPVNNSGDNSPTRTSKSRKSFFSLKPLNLNKPGITFDAFVDKQRGLSGPEVKSDYPTYKIDKRLVFLGEELEYPKFVIPFKSTTRRLWNLLIMALITYELLWYPVQLTYLFNKTIPTLMIVLEIIFIFVFVSDIVLNLRTTYADENNEEIIEPKMLRQNYMNSKMFYVDVITTVPLGEILLLILISSDNKFNYYSIFKMLGILRIYKMKYYSHHFSLTPLLKVLRTFLLFFIVTHWLSCLWYAIIRSQHVDTDDSSLVWFPVTLRTTQDVPQIFEFYDGMSTFDMYSYVLISVCMLMLGSDMIPVTTLQLYFSIIIGVLGAVLMAYIFGSVTFIINKVNAEDAFYEDKLESLRSKLTINKVPTNLKIKVMEYFYYSWRKHRVLSKTNDFGELSIPLQRDLAFFQYQETIMKVPLFKELEPIEILSIIQKLKTSVYMPGDKIIREGERGTEMYFIQEGKVEIIIKKPTVQADGTTVMNYQRIYLEKGSYFGEIALIANSKRTSDVNAYEFCILDTLSKTDYNNLKIEFPDIGPRLKAGLKHYKNNHMNQLIQIMKKLQYFEGFSDDDLKTIVQNYMEEIFVDPNKLVIKPKDKINSIYFLLIGSVSCFASNSETKTYLKHLKNSDNISRISGGEMDEENEDLDCIDDGILDMEKDQFSINDQKKKLKLVKGYSYGECFGTLDFEINDTKCRQFFITDSGCQLGIINQALLMKMAEEDYELYERLRLNFLRYAPQKIMTPIEEGITGSFRVRDRGISVDSRKSRHPSPISVQREKYLSSRKPVLKPEIEEEEPTVKQRLTSVEQKLDKFMDLILRLHVKQQNNGVDKLDKLDNSFGIEQDQNAGKTILRDSASSVHLPFGRAAHTPHTQSRFLHHNTSQEGKFKSRSSTLNQDEKSIESSENLENSNLSKQEL